MRFESVHRGWREGVGDDLALPSMLNTVPDIEYARDTGDESLIKVAFSKSVHVQQLGLCQDAYSLRKPFPCA